MVIEIAMKISLLRKLLLFDILFWVGHASKEYSHQLLIIVTFILTFVI